jgi:TetR/AcrR family transcriptional regulator, repressor for uid operon
LIRKGHATRQIDSDLDAEFAALVLTSVIDGSKTLKVRDPKLDIRKIADLVTFMITIARF